MRREQAPPRRSRAGPHRRFFDVWSRFYDVPWVQRMTYRPLHDAVLRMLARTTPRCVLDIGCGTGLLTSRMQGEFPGSRVVGCDFSPGMLERARRRDGRVRWVRADALGLPFRDQSFDAVVSTEAFHWFPDQHAALDEFFRLLAPGGQLLLALASPALGLLSEATHIGSRLVGEPLYWPTRRRLRASLRQAGFELAEQRRILRLPAPIAFPTFLTIAERPR